MYKKFLVISVMAFSWVGYGQQHISLDEVIENTRLHNLSIKVQDAEVDAAGKKKQLTLSYYLPQINLSYTMSNTNDPLNVFGTKLKQKMVTQSDFAPALLNDPEDITNHNAKVTLQQSLINPVYFPMRKAAKAQEEAQKQQLIRTENTLVFEARKAYLQLQMVYAADKVLQTARETVVENQSRVERMVAQGLAQNVDALSVQVSLTEIDNKIIDNKNQIQNMSDYINLLMGQPIGETLQPDEPEQDYTCVATLNEKTINEERADYLAFEKQIEAGKNMAKTYTMKSLPMLNAFGAYEFNDSDFGFGAENYMVGVQLSWSIFQGNSNRKQRQISQIEVEKAQYNFEQYKAKSELEFNKAKRDIELQSAKLILALQANEQAQERYRIRQNRFNEGLEKTTDLLQDQTQWLEKEFEELQTLLELQTAIYYFEYINQESLK